MTETTASQPDLTPQPRPSVPAKTKWLLMLSLSAIGMGGTIIFSVLPPVARDLNMSDWHVGLIITLGSAAFTFCAPAWGRLSDRWGRKPVIIAGFVGQGLAQVILAVVLWAGYHGVFSIVWLVAALSLTRTFFGIVGSGASPAVTAFVSDVTTPKERSATIGIVLAGFGLGAAIGPALGAIFIRIGPTIPFLVSAGFLFLAGCLVWLSIHEPKVHEEHRQSVKLRFADPRLIALGFSHFSLFTMVAGVQTVLGFHFQDLYGLTLQETTERAGIALLVASICIVVTQTIVAPRLGWPPAYLFRASALSMFIAHLGFLFVADFNWLLGFSVFLGLGFGFGSPAGPAGATMVVEDRERGAASGILIAAGSAGFIVGPLVYSSLYEWVQYHAMWLSVGLSILLYMTTLTSQTVRRLARS